MEVLFIFFYFFHLEDEYFLICHKTECLPKSGILCLWQEHKNTHSHTNMNKMCISCILMEMVRFCSVSICLWSILFSFFYKIAKLTLLSFLYHVRVANGLPPDETHKSFCTEPAGII